MSFNFNANDDFVTFLDKIQATSILKVKRFELVLRNRLWSVKKKRRVVEDLVHDFGARDWSTQVTWAQARQNLGKENTHRSSFANP